MDAANLNAQNNNARMLLKRWALRNVRITTLNYGEADMEVAGHPKIHSVRLWRRHAWYLHLFLRYLRGYDLIFYPGAHPADLAGIRWRRRLGFRAPLIATLEGLVGDAERERFYTAAAGHPVYCQQLDPPTLRRVDELLHAADHVIAISPFLARMGRLRYGDKFSVLPLGVDTTTYHPASDRTSNSEPVVVGAGSLWGTHGKRPEVFLALAERFPQVRFRWFGEGEARASLVTEVAAKQLANLTFPGSLTPSRLAEELRAADLFILPSHAEGVPKVTQEAAACGLPVIVFGYYESPTVVDGDNGYVVWSDQELMERIDILLKEPDLRRRFGAHGAAMAQGWDWDQLAPQWERQVMRFHEPIRPSFN